MDTILTEFFSRSDRSLDRTQTEKIAAELGRLSGLDVFDRSVDTDGRNLYFLGRTKDKNEDRLGVVTSDPDGAGRFTGSVTSGSAGSKRIDLVISPTSSENASALASALPYLKPKPLGLKQAIGCGDRLGLATPGHVRALRRFCTEETPMALIPAQQSIRENARTGRTPRGVLDDAVWGLFREGWRFGFGADADHLKTTDDVDSCLRAGYTFFTIDPGEHVDDRAESYSSGQLKEHLETLPWDVLDTDLDDITRRLTKEPIELASLRVDITEEALHRALVKYGRAVAHVTKLYRHLQESAAGHPFELEVSVDETESVTTVEEHIFIASELKRLGVEWISLAPRYVGKFEKGVDYIGDLRSLRENFKRHFAVSQAFGPYKLSLHSGSDKFSVYSVAREVTDGMVHLKTAGTSYLEALRTIAAVTPELFRQIFAFALERYETDRATYHVSGDLGRVPVVDRMGDEALPNLLENFDARQVLHVTFGSVLNTPALAGPFFGELTAQEHVYHDMLERHFVKHIAPFVEQ